MSARFSRLALLSISAALIHGPLQAERLSLDMDWRFTKGDVAGAEAVSFPDADWTAVTLPHDYGISGPIEESNPSGVNGGFYPAGIGWYRKILPPAGAWTGSGKRVIVTFDGIFMNSSVFVNGTRVAGRPNGFLPIRADITDALFADRPNTIAVRVDNEKMPSSRWYTGSGIYRHAWLDIVDPVHVALDGAFIRATEFVGKDVRGLASHEIVNTGPSEARGSLLLSVRGQDGQLVNLGQTQFTIPAGQTQTVETGFTLEDARRWDVDDPQLYDFAAQLTVDGEKQEAFLTRTGFRDLVVSVERGVVLNGRPIELQGVAIHQADGAVGNAVPDDVLRRRMHLIKEMGVNAIRTAHNPFAPEFYRLADEMGFLVMDEAFDGWEKEKVAYDYSLYFEDWWQHDLTAFIRRDRNHPSVAFWSVGNEVFGATPETQGKLAATIRALDPTRLITQGEGHELPHADIVGFNGNGEYVGAIEEYHAKHPDQPIIGTEITHTLHTRGVYRSRTEYRTRDNPAPWEILRDGMADQIWQRIKDRVHDVPDLSAEEVWSEEPLHYASSFDNNLVRMSIRDEIRLARKLPYLLGTFRWTAFDYPGESYAWPARTANFGVIDLAGFPKGPYYLYQSQWSAEPMIHLDPHWTHPGKEGMPVPVVVYSNLPQVELFLNGKSLGTQSLSADNMQASFIVPYAPGELSARASDGTTSLTASHRTAGAPKSVAVQADRAVMSANGQDVARLELQVLDQNGIPVPGATNALTVEISGPGKLLAFENGDILDLSRNDAPTKTLFRGKAAVLLQAGRSEGPLIVTVTGDGLETAQAMLDIRGS